MKTTKQTMALLAVIAFLITAGCGSSPSSRSGASSGPDELDTAIRDASDYLNDNIPAGSKIVILNIQSSSPDLSDYIIDELLANAVTDKVFSVVDRQQLDAIRSEQNFQWSGEVDDNSAMEIGKFFGAQTIVSGGVNRLGAGYRIRIRALEVQTAQVQGQYNRNIDSSRMIAAIMESGGSSGGTGTRTAAASGSTGGQTAQAATPAQPAAPTVNSQMQSAISFPRVGIWNVTGRDSINWTAKMVIDEIDIDRFSGYFEWRGGIDSGGREYFRGVYDSQTRKVSIQGYRLANNRGIGLGKYEAFLTRNNNDFESGTWSGGTWEAKWQQ